METAVRWYEERERGLGVRFAAALKEAFRNIAERPKSFARIPGTPVKSEVRRAFLKNFPYFVVFRERESAIRVIAAAHGRQRSGFWRDRL